MRISKNSRVNIDRYNLDQQAQSYISPEQTFLRNFQVLKDLLIEDNYTSIRNLNLSNHNFNQICSYLKGIIRKITLQNDTLSARVASLQEIIRKTNPKHPILSKSHMQQQQGLGEAGHKLSTFVPLFPKTAQNFASKFILPVTFQQKKVMPSSKDKHRQDARQQCQQIETFIRDQMQNSIVFDPSKKFSIPKEMILNLYLRWNQLANRRVLISRLSTIKSLLTNEIKRLFPNVDHCEKIYRGIRFRDDLMAGLEVKKEEETMQSTISGAQAINFEQQLMLDHLSDDNLAFDFDSS